MKKKIFLIFLLTIILVLQLAVTSNAAANIETYTYTTEENNVSSEILINGGTVQYSKPSPVYDFFDENGKFNVIYTSEKNVYWAKFNDNMEITNTIKIPQYYDKSNTAEELRELVYNFGNAIYYKEHLYIVFGREGTTAENGLKEDTMAVVKYDKNGKKVAETKLIAAQNNYFTDYRDGASLPFFPNGNCSLTINKKDETLACFFGTHMYSGHDRAGLFFVDINTMEWVSNRYYADDVNMDKYENIRDYYSAHSMSQRIIATEDGGYLLADQNDSSARGLLITRVKPDSNGNLQAVRARMLHFREGSNSTYGYNATHLLSGNIIELSDGFLYVGAMEKTLDLGYSYDINESWNVFVQKYNKEFSEDKSIEETQMFDTEPRKATGVKPTGNTYGRLYLTGTEVDYGIKWLTDLNNEKTVMQIRAVELENDNVAIIYETYDIEKSSSGNYYNEKSLSNEVYYMIIDGDGNIISSPTKIDNVNLTPEELFQYKDGKIYWTSTEEGDNTIKVNVLDVKNPIKYLRGDIDNDGEITTSDLSYGLKRLTGTPITEAEIERGDVTDDGEYTTADLSKLLRYLTGVIDEL